MSRYVSRRVMILARASTLAALAMVGVSVGESLADLSAQGRGFMRGGTGTSTSRVTSPTVVASWMSHQNYADGTLTTLLVLWRGTPGWFSKGGGGSSGGSGGSGSNGFQSFSQGGLTFTMEFDYDKHIVKMLNQEISLKQTNVVLVDFVDSANGPTIVGYRWVEPAPPVSPTTVARIAGTPVPTPTPEQQVAADPVVALVKRTPELFDYLQCDLTFADPVMQMMLPIICGQMRP